MSGIDEFAKILGAPKVHKPERAVKALISRCFSKDANLFIERFDIVGGTDSMCNCDFRTKAVVDLSMAIECSLKSLIISLSKDSETPIASYTKARKLSHYHQKLYKEVEIRAKRRIKLPRNNKNLMSDLKMLGIGVRYSYDVWRIRYEAIESKKFISLISSTIEDDQWIIKLRNEAAKFLVCAVKSEERYVAKHGKLYGQRWSAYDQSLKKFLKEIM